MEYKAPALRITPSTDIPGVHNAYACSSNFQSMAAKLNELAATRNFQGMLFLIQNCEEMRRLVAVGYGGLDARHVAPVQLMNNLGTFIHQQVLPIAHRIPFAQVAYSEPPMSFRITLYDSERNSRSWTITPNGVVGGGKLSKKSKSKKTRKSKKSRKTRKSNRL